MAGNLRNDGHGQLDENHEDGLEQSPDRGQRLSRTDSLAQPCPWLRDRGRSKSFADWTKRRRPIHAVYPVRLVQLLETGRHDDLRELVTRLHELEFSPGKSDSHGTAESEDDGDVEPDIIGDRIQTTHRRGKLDFEDEE